MSAKLLALLGALTLSACYPAMELTEKSTDSLLEANARVLQISSIAVTGIQSHRALQSFKEFSPRTTETVTCHKAQGTYLLSINDVNGVFDIVFNNCAGEDGGQLDGIVNGTIEQTTKGFVAHLSGGVIATKGRQLTHLKPTDLKLVVNDRSLLASVNYNGSFDIISDYFEGNVAVTTEQPFGFDARTYTYFGLMTYRDNNKNNLTVELDNNGAHISLNDQLIRSFTHAQWQARNKDLSY